MFKVFHAGDWHIGPFLGPEDNGVNLREKDTEKCLEKLVETVEEQRPELVLVPGDLFHTGKTWGDRQSREVITARRAISRMKAASGCVIVMRGTPNHDGSGQFELLKEFFSDVSDVHVVDYPKVIKTLWADIAVVPGFDRGIFRAKNAGLGKEEENEALSKELTNVVLGLKAECREGAPAVLMAHYTVPGCLDVGSHNRLLATAEPVLYRETLEAAAFDLAALGHIHKPQAVEGNIFYSGSLNALTFNDEGDEKGFWIHHFDGEGKEWLTDSEFVKTPYRPFLTMRLNNDEITAINTGRLEEVAMQRWRMDGCIQGCIVRVFYECTEENNKAFHRGVLQEALYEDGAFFVEVSPEHISLVADRTEMDKNTDPEENLKIYLENRGREQEDIERLIKLGRPIISMAVASGTAGGSAGVFEPIEIAVKNYRTYEEESFDFRYITFCTINGKNGAGKSSLFMDAIVDCIYEQSREGAAMTKRMKEVPWLRKSEKARSGSITFTFRIGEKVYRIVRTRTKSRKPTLNLSELVDGQWEDRSKEKIDDTQAEIENVIGMDCSTFKSCALIMQDNYGLFMEAKNNERMDILSKLLGLEIYAGMESITWGKVQELRRIVAAKNNEITVQTENIKTIGFPDEELKATNELLRVVEEKKADVATQLQLIQANLSRAEKADQRCLEISGEIWAAKERAGEMARNIDRLKASLSDVVSALEGEEDIIRNAEEYRNLVEREKELLEQTALYTARNSEKIILEQDIRVAEQTIDKINADILAAEQEIESLEERSDISAVQEKVAAYEQSKKTLDALYEKRSELDALNRKLSDAQHEKDIKAREFGQKEQLLSMESEELTKKTELLADSGCIDAEKASCRFLADAVAARDALGALPEKQAALECEKKAALDERQGIIDIVQGDIDKLGWNQDEFYRIMAECNSLEPYVKMLEQLQEQQRRIAVLRASIEQNKEMLTVHNEKVSVLKLRLLDVGETLDRNSAAFEEYGNIKQRIPLLAGEAEREKGLPVLKEQKKNHETRIAEISADMDALQKEITAKSERLEEEKKLTVNLAAYRQEAKQCIHQKEAYERDEKVYQTMIGGLEQKLADRKRMMDRINEIQEEVNGVAKELADYEALRLAFSSDGIPHQIIKKIIPRMEDIASSILGQMTAGKMGLRFLTERVQKSDKKKEEVTLDVVIEEFGGSTLPYLSKSGGEKVKASLSVILALAEIKASAAGIQFGFLQIDEPPFLDSDGTQAYVDALVAIQQRYPNLKVMAITHDQEFKARFPQNITVCKDEHGSHVRWE